jgi:hypothetical protein
MVAELGYAIALIGILAEKKGYNAFAIQLITNAKALRKDVSFLYYLLS